MLTETFKLQMETQWVARYCEVHGYWASVPGDLATGALIAGLDG